MQRKTGSSRIFFIDAELGVDFHIRCEYLSNRRWGAFEETERVTAMIERKQAAHEDFARRFALACDDNPNVPEMNFGRLTWIATEFKKRFDVDVTSETVRKWNNGLSRPHPYRKMVQQAEILRCDVAWLATGASEGVDKKQNKIRHEVADGSVNLIAGLVQMAGSHPAFPTPEDRFAVENHIDLYAIIRGVQHAFHIVVGEVKEEGVQFFVPVEVRNAILLGIVPEGGIKFSVVRIDIDSAEKVGTRRGNMLVVPLQEVEHAQVNSFAEKF
ncbi:helix-turn-helix DNA binding domain protein [Rhodobacter phage RcSalem]|nr:helix-turn-helix DNA binding domain protein [Rhodobacter phage RcSalem]